MGGRGIFDVQVSVEALENGGGGGGAGGGAGTLEIGESSCALESEGA